MNERIEKELMNMCNLGYGVYEQGLERGLEQGLEQGIERGIEQGEKNSKFEIAKKMLDKNFDISVISEAERNKILYKFNETETEYQSSKSVAQLFEEQVEKTPNKIAVVFGDEKITAVDHTEITKKIKIN